MPEPFQCFCHHCPELAEQLVAPATRVWDLASSSLYLLTDSSSIEKYSLAGKHLQTITKLGSFGVRFPMSVSPAGRSALFGIEQRGTVEIDIVQNFDQDR
jgi:hypothetical protein